MTDILFISPDSSKEVYQGLADRYSAIEPPIWALLLASQLGEYDSKILDPLAERLSDRDALIRILNDRPKLICFVVYGQNPNSGTTNMAGAVRLAKMIKESEALPIAIVGSHASALPEETLALRCFDYVIPGDGIQGLRKVMQQGVKEGVVWAPSSYLNTNLYNTYALPWKKLPTLDHYRCHTWHCNFDESKRSPFAAIYTSLGCPFKCDFCMINLVNREKPDQLDAAQSSGIRYFSTEFVLNELATLQSMGVRNVRLSDEMFFLNRQHYLPILDGIIASGLDLNLWAYARVDTVRPEHLPRFKRAGINWLCLGIESGNQKVRREAAKGSYEDVDVRQVAREIRDSGINLLANFIVGLPGDDLKSMNETLDLALELNAEHTNIYPCMPLPGSPLYRESPVKHADFSAYSFHSYDCQPLPTKYLSAADVLEFRDYAWERTALDPAHLSLIDRKFGTAGQIQEQAKLKLKRRLLEAA